MTLQQDLGERVARLEEQNKAGAEFHEQFRQDIGELKESTTRIETTLELLVTNGHRGRIRAVVPYGGATVFLGALAGVLKWLG